MRFSAGLGSLLLMATSAQANWSASITLATEYELTGISQSAENPVVQAGLAHHWDTGFYAGTWVGSGIDFGCCDAASEVDYYAGYSHKIGTSWWWDASLNKYTYPGSINLAYTESALQLRYNQGKNAWNMRLGWSGNFLATGRRGFYAEAQYTRSLNAHWSFSGHVGKTGGSAFRRELIGFPAYYDYALGLHYELKAFSANLRWVNTTLDGKDKINAGVLRNTGRWVMALSWAY